MNEALSAALATEGLIWLVVACFVAGLVRGFSGFGTAMIYMPVASSVLSPVWALTTIIVFDLFGPLPNVPRALRDGHPRDVLRLGVGALVAMPFGIFVLTISDPVIFRWMVSCLALILLVILLSGWRYAGVLNRRTIFGVGALGGFLGGSVGLAGPPVILLYMSSRHAVDVIRANNILYLLLTDILVIGLFAVTGLLESVPIFIALVLVIPYSIANIVGAAIFDPEREKTYRTIAYIVIAASALYGLPLFD